MKLRNHAFDLRCGLCILRMIMLHVISTCGYRGEFWFTKVMAWSFFFMSFFFFKAGYFNKGISTPTWQYLKDRTRRLLVPYATWGIIGSVVYFSYLWLFPDNFQKYYKLLKWEHLWEDSHVWGDPPLWFLFSFWAAYVLVHFIKKIHIVKPISVFQTVVILACPFLSYWMWTLDNPLPMSLSNVFMGVFFFNLGRTWRWLMDRMGRTLTLTVSSVLIAAFVVLNIVWHGEYVMSTNRFEGESLAAFFNTVIILLGLSGLLIKLPLGRVPVVNYVGQHSMVYFVAHYPLLQFYRFTHICFGHSIYGHWDDFIVLLVFVFGFCTWLVPYVEKVPWLSGRWKK